MIGLKIFMATVKTENAIGENAFLKGDFPYEKRSCRETKGTA